MGERILQKLKFGYFKKCYFIKTLLTIKNVIHIYNLKLKTLKRTSFKRSKSV